MKRLILIFATTLCLSSLHAQSIDAATAQFAAKQYISVIEPSLSQIPTSLYNTVVGTDNAPLFYIYNIGDRGFIIVGSRQDETPVIGYSFNGPYDSVAMPDALKSWLDGYAQDLQAVRASTSRPQPIEEHQTRCRNEWYALQHDASSFYSGSSKGVNALLQTQWDQGAGYNDYCPAYNSSYTNNGHSVTGCVATAMAQIIRYHRYPSRGFYHSSYGHSYFGTLEAQYDSAYYDYNQMPNQITYYSSQNQRHAVSLLCYHCGVAVKMNYENPTHTTGSGAASSDVPDALKFFGYTNAYQLVKSSFSSSVWDSMLRHDLDRGLPVYYSGSNSDGGHAFVCDGYNNSGKYHFNFGWSGSGDGYYSLTSVHGYSSNQAAVFNITPSGLAPFNNQYYVDCDKQGDGSSWSAATPNLEAAMEICGLYKKGNIWVKSGTYYGDTNGTSAFTMPSGTKIYGGFDGTESSVNDRNPENPPSIMSGKGERMVLYSPSLSSSSNIYNMTFADGYASDGSGVTMSTGLKLENCIVERNSSSTANGSAVSIGSGGILCCLIRHNYCSGVSLSGGYIKNSIVMHNDGTGITGTNNTLIDGCNIVCNNGTGIANTNVKIRNCVIWHNQSSLSSDNISKTFFSAIEGFGDLDSNSNFGLVAINRPPAEGLGPYFIDPDTVMGPSDRDGDWHLSIHSPLIDAGDTVRGASYERDLDGNIRIRNYRTDIGCYERLPGNNIDRPSEHYGIKAYPNPTSSMLTIETAAGTIQLFDIMGRLLLTAESDGKTLLDISYLSRGVYMLRTENDTIKIIKK